MLLLVTMLGVLGCDARTPEPAAKQEERGGSKSERKAGATTATGLSAMPLRPRRCIRETQEKPQRVVSGPVPNPACPADPQTPPDLRRAAVEFPEASGGPKRVDAEIAELDADRQRGLMYRKSLPEDDGMLFVFEREQVLKFWMHNTCIPLDMIFIAKDGTIVGIEENTPTLSDDTFTPNCAAQYVLEMNAGWTRKNGVKAGMKVKLP